MAFSREIEAFAKEFAADISNNSAAIFAGAGMSKGAGYVDWAELLHDIAEELGLDVKLEHDLISVAQFHVNQLQNSAKLTRKIVEEFAEQAESTDTHEILARLPIGTYWTTNYDTLIEDSLREASKVADVKSDVEQLNTTRPKRDAVVYKMHGSVTHASKAILYKQQYEQYHRTHEPFVTALSGDLVSKTFLFIGFSFTDPNLDYVLSRLHTGAKRNHYCFMKREIESAGDDAETARYKIRKQELRIQDLKRFGIQTLLINKHEDIPKILRAIEARFLKKTVFIGGSAEEFGDWDRNDALNFIHSLSAQLVGNGYRVVSGFGWGVGSAVINGALETIYDNPEKFSEDQLLMRPFPQVASKGTELATLWKQYRQRMLSLAGVAIFVFGNKLDPNDKGKIVNANGMIAEFDIAMEKGAIPVPIGATGFAARDIWETVMAQPAKYYAEHDWLPPLVEKLGESELPPQELVRTLLTIVDRLNK
ncbi:SIR2 family protein [Paraburkholderia aspalathi]|uniref:NAD(+) hydrolase ThsA n=1 Tax=Paraburkholderia aspalathi TaxID=1324617 RepID=A0A1I7BDY6_9BURK|nr:SIR2 family protein [Paraburkholderia aspalathi]SFT85377.1 SIR2-like domain-containing protein [Paraburkholderia aspalathi]